MKKLTLALLCSLVACSSISAQSASEKPKLKDAKSWSLILVPDIQNYVKYERNQPILDLMCAWISDQVDSLNIKMVMCTGDLVEQNEIINNGHDGNQTSHQQWTAAVSSFAKLNGKTPYILASGNHDYSVDRQGNRSSNYAKYVHIESNALNRKAIVQNATNEQGQATLENSALELKQLHGQDYLFLTMEYAPRDTMVSWASRIVNLEQYKKHRVVLLTHEYLNTKDKRTTGTPQWFTYEPYAINNEIQKSAKVDLPRANNGQQLWEKLIQPSSNIELVLSGHINGEGYRADKNSSGKKTHQMLFDMQNEGGGHRNGNGGDGWLRILEFLPDGKTVIVKTYSPLFGASPTTQKFAWKKDERNEFSFSFD